MSPLKNEKLRLRISETPCTFNSLAKLNRSEKIAYKIKLSLSGVPALHYITRKFTLNFYHENSH